MRRRNSYRLGKHPSSYYLQAFDGGTLREDGDTACIALCRDDPAFEFEVHLPVEWGELRIDLKPLARSLLAEIVELDDHVRASHDDAYDDDERLALVVVREFYCEFRYFSTAWNSDWCEYFTRDASGTWRHRGKALPWMRQGQAEREPAIVAVDGAYSETRSAGGGVFFLDWASDDAVELSSVLIESAPPAYEPGAFYKRELPLIMAVLETAQRPVSTVIVDGYVWLSGDKKPGLGARLYEALGRSIPVIGVAKTTFQDDTWSAQVRRGASTAPLFVTSVGIDRTDAARRIARMSGEGRTPKLISLADRKARSAVTS